MFRYKIDEIYNKKAENNKHLNLYKDDYYFIKHLSIGTSAILYNDNGRRLETSLVESLHIWENGIKFETKNTIYYLKPVMTGVV